MPNNFNILKLKREIFYYVSQYILNRLETVISKDNNIIYDKFFLIISLIFILLLIKISFLKKNIQFIR